MFQSLEIFREIIIKHHKIVSKLVTILLAVYRCVEFSQFLVLVLLVYMYCELPALCCDIEVSCACRTIPW